MSIFAILFVCLVAASVVAGKLPPLVLDLYLAASMITFAFYAVDKSAALNGRRRTREKTLQLLGLIGGWPGALLGQSVLRHKSRKPSFQRLFRITVVVNCAALVWLLLARG